MTIATRALVVLLVMLAAACTTTTASPTARAEPTTEVTASPSPTGEETAEGEPSACEPGVLCDGPLEAGTYTTDVVGDTTVTLELDEGWTGQILPGADGIALYPADSDRNGMYIFRYTGEVFADPCDIESATAIDSDPAAIIAWLREHPEMHGDGPYDITMGDAIGEYTNVDVQKTEECTGDGPPPEWVLLFVLPEVGDFHLEEDSRALVAAVSAGEETVIVVIEALENLDGFMGQTRAIIPTINVSSP